MAASGSTRIDFNETFFEDILRSSGVQSLCAAKAQMALGVAQRNAPVDTGDYKRGLTVEKVSHTKRYTYMVVGHDPKTLLVESQTQNLARALKAVS